MVSDLQTAANNNQLLEIWVPEFGLLDNRQLDFNRRYQGRIYRFPSEAMKAVCEALGFSAKFDLAAIRTAYADLWKTEGAVVFEIDRNTRPLDISLRYSRDRWNVIDNGAGRGQDALRPWIKSTYRARYIEPKLLAQIADTFKVRLDEMSNAFVRLNFKERTFAFVVDEKQMEILPTGAFSSFNIPGNCLPTVVADEVNEDAGATEYGADADGDWTINIGANEMSDMEANREATTPSAVATVEAATNPEPSLAEPASPAETQAVAEAESTGAVAVAQEAAPLAAEQAEVQETAAEQTAAQAPVSAAVPLAVAAAQARPGKKTSVQYDNAPLPAPTPKPQPRPSSSSYSQGGQAKYDTYSKSEVDYMLKQQAESILSALSGKVAAQQRAFQEAIASQEKAFNRISNDFLSQFEATRVKLENTARSTHEGTKGELDQFHKLLEKELEQYRTQINKVVLPVTRAMEGKAVASGKDAKQAGNVPPKVQQALATTQAKLERLLVFVLGFSAVSMIASLLALYCAVHR